MEKPETEVVIEEEAFDPTVMLSIIVGVITFLAALALVLFILLYRKRMMKKHAASDEHDKHDEHEKPDEHDKHDKHEHDEHDEHDTHEKHDKHDKHDRKADSKVTDEHERKANPEQKKEGSDIKKAKSNASSHESEISSVSLHGTSQHILKKPEDEVHDDLEAYTAQMARNENSMLDMSDIKTPLQLKRKRGKGIRDSRTTIQSADFIGITSPSPTSAKSPSKNVIGASSISSKTPSRRKLDKTPAKTE